MLSKTDPKLVEVISDWYLQRFNFYRAYRLAVEHHPSHFYYIHASWMVLGLGLLILFLFDPSFGFLPKLILAYLATILGVILINEITDHHFTEPGKPQKPRLQLLTIVNYLSPKLVITLILAWFVYKEFADLNNLSVARAVGYYVIAILVIPLYLLRAIKTIAPDMDNTDASIRLILILGRTYLLTLLVGLIVLGGLTKWETPPVDLKLAEFYFPFALAFRHAGFVFFTGLFVNLLFKDKRVTGF